MISDGTITFSLLACRLPTAKQDHLVESGAGSLGRKGDCHIIVEGGLGGKPNPHNFQKNLVCLLSEGLLGAGFNLRGNLLRG